jgi:hypothetical protein
MRYEINPSDLDDKNLFLIKVNQEILQPLLRQVTQYVQELEQRRPEDKSDDAVLLQRFRVLVAMSLQYGLDAGDISDQLGVTLSTVHRWAKGTFVPPQVFVRAAAMRGIQLLLERELAGLTVAGRTSSAQRFVPHIRGSYSEPEQKTGERVVAFDSSKSTA